MCPELEDAIWTVATNIPIFQRPWVFLKRNLSGKYRVTPLSTTCEQFEQLKRRTDAVMRDGIYISFSEPRLIELMHSDADASDFLFPNGGFTEKRHQLVSYISGDNPYEESSPYLVPAQSLPPSETEGLGILEVQGQTFGNLPEIQHDYISRKELELRLKTQLSLVDSHPIVTLTGPGGIGKTWLALKCLRDIQADPSCPYQNVIWFSARDIDLMLEGAKSVQPRGVTLEDFASFFCSLVGANCSSRKEQVQRLADEMHQPSFGNTIWAFDNFETVINPGDMFRWIDTFVRPQNKVLITTRIRGDFRGDWPVEVGGMSDPECNALIEQTARKLGVSHLLTDEYRRDLVRESDGHPYVIKILLGEAAKARSLHKINRIVASQDEILIALFERTYNMLSPGAQRVFLTLSSWNSVIPEIAVEAVLLRSANERFEVQKSIDELEQSSFVERVKAENGESFLSVPLTASLFGRRKLSVSVWQAAVSADTELLHDFGAGQKSDVIHGVEPRIERFFRTAANTIGHSKEKYQELLPVLEFIARHHSRCWLRLADLAEEALANEGYSEIKRCLEQYLAKPDCGDNLSWIWKRLADISRESEDLLGELHAIASMCRTKDIPMSVISSAANRINNRLSSATDDIRNSLAQEEKRHLIRQIADALAKHRSELTADDCSRLAWLYLHLNDEERASEAAKWGLAMESNNQYCLSLRKRLTSR